MGSFESALSETMDSSGLFLLNGNSLVGVTMNTIGHPAEPNRELVERAIVEMLGIIQRQGITAADFVRLLDSGIRMSDFLIAIDPTKNSDHTAHSNVS
jgi:hypothetical protein